MLKQLIVALTLGSTLLGISGCAKQEFRKEQLSEVEGLNGSRAIPPKIDILIVADNTPSVANPYPTLQAEIANFIADLQQKNWDFHIAQMPVELLNPSLNYHPITQVLVNPAYNSHVLADGSFTSGTGIVPQSAALTNASSFQIGNFPIITSGNGDNTYTNMYNTLTRAQSDLYTNFLRADAPLAIIIVSNGYDRTITDNHGQMISGGTTNLANYASNLVSLKGSQNMLRFYPVVSYGWAQTNCLTAGGSALPGTSYFAMLNGYLQGASFNFCDMNSLGSAMANIEADLAKVVVQSYIFSAIVLDQEPLIDSKFQVLKDGQVLNQDSSNGWQYLGRQSTYQVYNVCDPNDQSNIDRSGVCPGGTIKPINPPRMPATGYVIQLNGSARMTRANTYNVVYDRR